MQHAGDDRLLRNVEEQHETEWTFGLHHVGTTDSPGNTASSVLRTALWIDGLACGVDGHELVHGHLVLVLAQAAQVRPSRVDESIPAVCVAFATPASQRPIGHGRIDLGYRTFTRSNRAQWSQNQSQRQVRLLCKRPRRWNGSQRRPNVSNVGVAVVDDPELRKRVWWQWFVGLLCWIVHGEVEMRFAVPVHIREWRWHCGWINFLRWPLFEACPWSSRCCCWQW